MNSSIKWLVMGAVAVFAACSPDGAFDDTPTPVGPQTPSESSFKVTVGASSESGSEAAGTRAEYDGVTYRWSPADKVGFYMAPAGSDDPIIRNARLTSTNAAASPTADFEGELDENSIRKISSNGKYDYYSYFPYDAGNAGFPNVAFGIPGEITVEPDVFPAEYGFMVAEKVTTATGGKPITWLDDQDTQRFGEYVGFKYKHVFAYLEVHLAINLMSQNITKIKVTCTDTDAKLSGTANIDIRTGAVSFTSGTNSITVNIGGSGLDIRSATDYDRIWIPIDPSLAGKEFRFDFYSAEGNTSGQTVTGGTLEAGKKHKAGLKVPWVCNFSDLATRDNSWSLGGFSHKGYDFWCWRINTKEESSYFDGAMISAGNHNGINVFDECRGQIRTQAIKSANTLGLTDIPVRVTFTGTGNSPERREVRYDFCASTTTSFASSALKGPLNLDLNKNKAYSFEGVLAPSKPALVLEPRTWGAYWLMIQEIKIELAN